MLKGTGITELDLNQDSQDYLKNKTSNFDEADIQKSYSQSQGKGDEIFTIASRSHQIGRELQAQTKTASPPDLNIAPDEYTSITSGINHETAEDDCASLLGGA